MYRKKYSIGHLIISYNAGGIFNVLLVAKLTKPLAVGALRDTVVVSRLVMPIPQVSTQPKQAKIFKLD